MESKDLAKLLGEIKDQGKTLYIVGHIPPDYDSLGSAFGLAHLAKHLGLEAKVCSEYTHDAGYLQNNVLYNELDIGKKVVDHSEIKEGDPVAFVDVFPQDTNCPQVAGETRLIINHHPIDDSELAQYKGVLTDTRQTGSNIAMIAEHMINLGAELSESDKDLATLMLYGIRVDTKKYQRSEELDHVISPFIERYADRELITTIESRRYPREVLNIMKGMEEKEVGNYRFAVVKVTKAALVRPLADAISDYEGSPISIVVSKVSDGEERDWIVIGRSNNSAYNVSETIKQVFNTGRGKWNAAGAAMTTKEVYKKFRVDESKDTSVLKQILESLERKLKKLSNEK